MGKVKYLGELEIVIIAALMRLGEDAYGVRIAEEIKSRSGRDVSVGALYSTLSRLEEKAYVESQLGVATPERGGRAKRFFSVTDLGAKQFDLSLSMLTRMTDGLPAKGALA